MPVNIKDVARECGVSVSTVSNILRNKPNSFIGEATRARVQAMAKQLGYRPHHAASSLRNGSTNSIGLIIPDIRNPFCSEQAWFFEEAVAEKGYRLVTMNSSRQENEIKFLEEVLERRCDGVIGLLSFFDPVKHLLPEFAKNKIPCILVGIPLDISVLVDGVIVDETRGYDLAIRHLVELGHTEIAQLGSYPPGFAREVRSAAFTSAMQRSGLKCSQNNIIIRHFQDHFSDGYNIVDDLLENYPKATAAIGVNDVFVTGMMRRFTELGIRIPEDISLIGSDNTWLASSFPVPLTSIDLNTRNAVKAATDMLFTRLSSDDWESPMRTTIECGLAVRASTARVRALR